MPRSTGRDLCEVFGFTPDDITETARWHWKEGFCPFTKQPCTKKNHDGSIVYGVCSVKGSKGEEIIICPNRLYCENNAVLRSIAASAFGADTPMLDFAEYEAVGPRRDAMVVAIGKGSGREISIGKLRLDWVLALVVDGEVCDYLGVEVQSMDITGNYRDAWEAYRRMPCEVPTEVPCSKHGLNWANVHKRLIPQLIRKGLVFSKSAVCTQGLHFVLPEIVYLRFEQIVGVLPKTDEIGKDVLSIHTFELTAPVPPGHMRSLRQVRTIRHKLKDFIAGFIAAVNVPSGELLDVAVSRTLGLGDFS